MVAMTMRLFGFVTLLVLPWYASAAADLKCYLRSGEYHSISQPCDPDADVSHCCQKDYHICLSNKLCFDIAFNHVIEGSCTDQTWDSDACSQYCKNTPTLSTWGDIRQCNGLDDQWVCGADPSSCNDSFSVPAGYIDDKRTTEQEAILALPPAYTAGLNATSTVTVTVTPPSTASSTSSTSSTVAANDTTSECHEGSGKLTVGLGAGLGVGVPLLIALITMIVLLMREKRVVGKLHQQQQQQVQQPVDHPGHSGNAGGQYYHEAESGYRPKEAPGGHIYEADSGH